MKIFKSLRLLVPMLALSTIAFSCASQGSPNNGGNCDAISEKVSVDEFQKQLSSASDYILLDVRTADEFNAGHLDGAINIDFYAADAKDQFSKLDKEKPVLIYCKSGARSGKSAAIMKDLCFKNVKDMQGGYMAWSSKGLKTVK